MTTISSISPDGHLEKELSQQYNEYLPLTLSDQMLQVHKVLHTLQHLEVQLLHYSYSPVLGLFLKTALNDTNEIAKVISNKANRLSFTKQ